MKSLSSVVLFAICSLAVMRPGIAAAQTWSMSQERFVVNESGMTLQELASGGVTMIVPTPTTQQYFDEAHRWGVKVLPYISLYKVLDSSKGNPVEDGVPISQSPFWKAVDAYALHHPEWVLMGADGQPRRPFDDPNYPAFLQQSCCNYQSLINAYAQGARNLMNMGADGVYVDNVHPTADCSYNTGVSWPTLNNAQCYTMALGNVYNTVKSYGQNRAVVLNPGGPAGNYAPYGDASLWESFMWRSPYTGQPAGSPTQTLRWDPQTWDNLLTSRSIYRPNGDNSPSVAPLTYLPRDSEAQSAFYAYSAARLAGYDQWSGNVAERRDILRRLYRVKSGAATSSIVEAGGAAYRQFQNAMMVCNHSTQTMSVRMPVPSSLSGSLIELYNMQETPIVNGYVTLSLPAGAGRVVVSRADGLDNVLQEIEGESLAAQLYIEQGNYYYYGAHALHELLHEIQTDATALRATVRQTGFPHGSDLGTLAEVYRDAASVQAPANDSFLIERLGNVRNYAAIMSNLVPVPEPGMFTLTITGLIGLLAYAWQRRK
jgi:hypothetical protein